jgi:hypothetical protein
MFFTLLVCQILEAVYFFMQKKKKQFLQLQLQIGICLTRGWQLSGQSRDASDIAR